MKTFNFYEDERYAEAYSKLEFPGTYYLAFRDLPWIIRKHVIGTKAIDFGCGAGRSTRFLRKLGFDVIGVDISEEMVQKAREKDGEGEYKIIANGDFSQLEQGVYNLVLSAFTFDNIPSIAGKIHLFRSFNQLLAPEGKIVNLVSSPEIYTHEWDSFTTNQFPENRNARDGDEVKIVNRAIEDQRPVTDIFMSDDAYKKVYSNAGLRIDEAHKPLAKRDEPFAWVNEMTISPWVIYVLSKAISTL